MIFAILAILALVYILRGPLLMMAGHVYAHQVVGVPSHRPARARRAS